MTLTQIRPAFQLSGTVKDTREPAGASQLRIQYFSGLFLDTNAVYVPGCMVRNGTTRIQVGEHLCWGEV